MSDCQEGGRPLKEDFHQEIPGTKPNLVSVPSSTLASHIWYRKLGMNASWDSLALRPEQV